jgi:anti-sigma regulatory factor (Ser/Thr protein kinase)
LCWRKAFPGAEHEVRAVRQWIAGLLPDCPSRDDVVTVAVELATNALKFSASGGGGDSGWFAVELTWHHSVLRVAVADGGGSPDGPALAGDTDGEHGRGLRIVHALSARTGICGDQQGRVVWADVPWAGDSPPGPFTVGQEAAIHEQEAVLAARYAGVSAWFGRTTLQWWALPAAGGELVSAPSAADLARQIDCVPGSREPHNAAPAGPGTARAGRRSAASAASAPSRHHTPATLVHTAVAAGQRGLTANRTGQGNQGATAVRRMGS